MKQIKLTIRPENTGKMNWSDTSNCPIACALKEEGFMDVNVYEEKAFATRIESAFFGIVDVKREYLFKISDETNKFVKSLTNSQQFKDNYITLEYQRINPDKFTW